MGHEERIKALEEFQAEIDKIKESLIIYRKDLEQYKNSNIIQSDQDKIDLLKKKAASIHQAVASESEKVITTNPRKELVQLTSYKDEREEYIKQENKRTQLETAPSNSPRLIKYFEHLKNSKHTQAKISYVTLSKDEKELALEFEKTHNFLLREKNVQPELIKSINFQEKKLQEALQLPEAAVSKIKELKTELEGPKTDFLKLQEALAQTQFDLKLETWPLGLFKCESKDAQYLRPKNYPNLILLKNENNLRSVIKLNPENPKSFEIAYACKKLGSLGGCLEDDTKALCRLDEECLAHLTTIDNSYNKNEYFTKIQNRWPRDILREKQDSYLKDTPENLLQFMKEQGSLGYYSIEELAEMMTPVIEFSQNLKASTPEEYFKKIKTEIERRQKLMLATISKKAGANPSSKKIEQTKTAMNYLFVSMVTGLEKIQNNDDIQDYSYEKCGSIDGQEEFCQESLAWKKKVERFNETTELRNLTPNECPRAVFRESPSNDRAENDCSPALQAPIDIEIMNLNKYLKDSHI